MQFLALVAGFPSSPNYTIHFPPTTQGIMGHVQVANMAINKAEKSRASVLLKESAIPEASPAGRKPADLGKATLLF